MKLLVTGGAGYIGSHVVRQLGEAGHQIVVYDDLSTGREEAVLYGDLVQGTLSDRQALASLFSTHRFDAVLHFAAKIVVPESVAHPLMYYRNNTSNTLNLLETMQEYQVKYLVFSCTAAVYGIPDQVPVSEQAPLQPINPYGASKMMSERMIADYASSSDMQFVSLRYFNVAGADLQCRIGQATPNATHLIKVGCEAAVGKRESVSIFGTDFSTPDGTGVRDYIHVEDLASAHLASLDFLVNENRSEILNCGYGRGYSVREVLDEITAVAGGSFKILEAPRRAGDPPQLVANNEKILTELNWSPKYNDLSVIIQSALKWEEKLAKSRV
ncbi:MAG TPA: UDP-glucose 4-epimerase GalE [Gammaproteobacteria bacterium]|nr:UDP-glucose 4-epimerase GalE [Gammaproteobacteria bacterium]